MAAKKGKPRKTKTASAKSKSGSTEGASTAKKGTSRKSGEKIGPPAKDIKDLMAGFDKRFKGNVRLQRASETDYPFDLRRPTGILQVDVGMGGGWPAAALSQVFGPEGIGKTMTMLRTIAQTQRIYREDANVAYVSLGYGLDRMHARACGAQIAFSDYEIDQLNKEADRVGEQPLDKETVSELQAQVGEFLVIEVGEGDLAYNKPMEAQLEGILDIIRSGLFQVVVVDEGAGAGATSDRLSRELGENPKTGDEARLTTDFLRKFYYAVRTRPAGRANETTVLLGSQTRMHIETNPWMAKRSGQKYNQPGGQALKHVKAIDLHLFPKGRLKDTKGRIVGKQVGWRIAKAKLGTHEGAEGVFEIQWGIDGFIDEVRDVAEACRALGIIKNRGSVYDISRAGRTVIKGVKGGFEGVVEQLYGEEELVETLRLEVLRSIEGQWRHK